VDDPEDHVLRVDAGRERPVDPDLAELRLRHRETLGRQHVAHLGGADAERDGADGTVRRGVAVAAGDGHARLAQAQLGPDDVDDALLARRHVEERHAKVLGVADHVDRHLLGQGVGVGTALVRGRDDVVEGGEGARGHADLHLRVRQPLEGLRGRHLVDEVETDQELGLPRGQRPHRVRFPHFVEQRACHEKAPRPSAGEWTGREAPAEGPARLCCATLIM
jgi:hypothetical protein